MDVPGELLGAHEVGSGPLAPLPQQQVQQEEGGVLLLARGDVLAHETGCLEQPLEQPFETLVVRQEGGVRGDGAHLPGTLLLHFEGQHFGSEFELEAGSHFPVGGGGSGVGSGAGVVETDLAGRGGVVVGESELAVVAVELAGGTVSRESSNFDP